MTSPTGKQQKQPQSAKVEAMEVLEQTAAALHYKAIQLQRTLWLAAQQNGGSLVLDEQKMDLLWKLGFERTPEGHLKVTASTMTEADPADVERMAKDLTGTNGSITEYAEAHERLRQYPPQYIEFILSKHIRSDGTVWLSIADFEAKQRAAAPPPA